jgi:von Willebrand factor type A domain
MVNATGQPPSSAISSAAAPTTMAANVTPPVAVRTGETGAPAIAAVTSRPIALALLIDDSENMRRDTETVARALPQMQVPPGAKSAVLHFQKRAVLDEPLSSGRTALAAPQLPPAKGGAALYDGVIAAANAVAGSAQRSKAVVVVSTGGDTGSHASARDVVAHTSAIPGLAIYGIVVGDGTRSNDLQDLARTTGGLVYSARDPQQVLLAYDAITRRVADHSATPAYAAAPELQPDRLHAMDFRRPLALYNALVVEPIPIAQGNETRDFPAGDDFILQRVLVARLKDSRTFPRVVSGTDAEARQAAADPNLRTVELVGTVVRYRKGSRLRRAMMGMGSTSVNVRFVLRDLQSGQVLAVIDKEGSGSSGLITGGNAQEQETQALLQVVNGVVKDIQKNR